LPKNKIADKKINIRPQPSKFLQIFGLVPESSDKWKVSTIIFNGFGLVFSSPIYLKEGGGHFVLL
jgi:hypothetical protein